MSESLPDLSERAELEALRDLSQRLLNFGGDDTVLMPWIDAHRRHRDEPYIGCPFCRDQFVPVVERDRLRAENEMLRAILNGCDDEAIERAADAVRRAYNDVIDRRLLKELWPTVALAALRAAGERSVETDDIDLTKET